MNDRLFVLTPLADVITFSGDGLQDVSATARLVYPALKQSAWFSDWFQTIRSFCRGMLVVRGVR
jgi:hypothetical protein